MINPPAPPCGPKPTKADLAMRYSQLELEPEMEPLVEQEVEVMPVPVPIVMVVEASEAPATLGNGSSCSYLAGSREEGGLV